ncbi:putative transcription factor bZIP family [Lupinus albus]|uniref:Putative transcription factor bZIP family n=1 Tax=Lupinus albus TaxID=3870 RepID=A0A6A4R2Y9_LUPAL|nr:putative transcription factor bZIP family [Lupinus albus]
MEPFKRGKIPRETETHEELHNRVENLRNEVSELRKELLRISEESKEVEKENESLVEELIEKYGEESIADLISKNPSAP